MLNRLIIPLCFLVLLGIGLLRNNPANIERVDSYHEHVRTLIETIPVDVNGWSGQKVPLPQSATNLLRPNALIARRYVHLERDLQATLMIVQCRDARDMAGHFPPRCYPANGWLTQEETTDPLVEVSGQEMRRYAFHRVAGRVERDIFVYNIFALPTGELTVSMGDVRRLSADYEYRLLGAAQIQILIDGATSPDEHAWILDEMYAVVAPAIEAVRDAQNVTDPNEGSKR